MSPWPSELKPLNSEAFFVSRLRISGVGVCVQDVAAGLELKNYGNMAAELISAEAMTLVLVPSPTVKANQRAFLGAWVHAWTWRFEVAVNNN